MVLANVLAATALLIGVFSVVIGASLGIISLGILLAVLAIFVQLGVYSRALREDLAEVARLVRGIV
jgi:hypothetical protein